MKEILFNVVCDLKANSKSEESFKKDLESAINIYTQSIELSVLNRLRMIAANKELPKELFDMVNNVADSVYNSKSIYLNNREKLVEVLADEIFHGRTGKKLNQEVDSVVDHYRCIAIKILLRIEPLLKAQSSEEITRLTNAFYISIKGIENDLLSDDDIENICHSVMMDIHNTTLGAGDDIGTQDSE